MVIVVTGCGVIFYYSMHGEQIIVCRVIVFNVIVIGFLHDYAGVSDDFSL